MIKTIRLFFDARSIGSILLFMGSLISISSAFSSLYLDMMAVKGLAGFRGFMAAFALFPFTSVVLPWYALLLCGIPAPMALCYCGVMAGSLVLFAAISIKGPSLFSGHGNATRPGASGKTRIKKREGSI